MKDPVGTTMLAGHSSGRNARYDRASPDYARRLAMGETAPRTTLVISDVVEARRQKILRSKGAKKDDAPKNDQTLAWQKPVVVEPKEGMEEIYEALVKKHKCIRLEAPLRDGTYAFVDSDERDAIVGIAVVEVSPGMGKVKKMKPLSAIGTLKKFHKASFFVTDSALKRRDPGGYKNQLYREFFEFLTAYPYDWKSAISPTRLRHDSMPWDEAPPVFKVGP